MKGRSWLLLFLPIALVIGIPAALIIAVLPASASTDSSCTPVPVGQEVTQIPPPQSEGLQHAITPVATPIPAAVLPIYQRTGGTLWPLLAGIGYEETRHGASIAVSSAGAIGFMQFEPSTWASYGQGGDPNNPADAIPAAWRYLNASGPLTSAAAIRAAIYSYNHDFSYVDDVLWWARQYAAQYASGKATPTSTDPSAVTVPAGCTSGTSASGDVVVSGKGCTDPLPGSTISQHFGHNGHPGVDLAGVPQENVVAACSGHIVFAGPAQGFGDNYVIEQLDGDPNIFLSYGHMNQMYVAVGAPVAAGQPLGQEGWEGYVIPAGPGGLHLHFQCQTGSMWGQVCNPEQFLSANGVTIS